MTVLGDVFGIEKRVSLHRQLAPKAGHKEFSKEFILFLPFLALLQRMAECVLANISLPTNLMTL